MAMMPGQVAPPASCATAMTSTAPSAATPRPNAVEDGSGLRSRSHSDSGRTSHAIAPNCASAAASPTGIDRSIGLRSREELGLHAAELGPATAAVGRRCRGATSLGDGLARDATPSLCRMLCTWFFTVAGARSATRRDPLVRQSLRDQVEHLALSRRQRLLGRRPVFGRKRPHALDQQCPQFR